MGMTQEWSEAEQIIVTLAREFANGYHLIQGSFTPLGTVACLLAKMHHAPEAIFHAGPVDVKPFRLTLTTYDEAGHRSAVGTFHVDQQHMILFWGGHCHVEMISPAQIDMYGNVNTSVIGEYHRPRVRLPGGAGTAGGREQHKKGLVYVTRHNRRVFVPRVDFITGAGYLGGGEERERRGIRHGNPYKVVTNLCVLDYEPVTRRLRLHALHPGKTVQEVIDNTGFALIIPDRVPTTEPPTPEQLVLIREKIDPLGLRELEFLSGEARRAYLRQVLEREIALIRGMRTAERDLL
ncbi:MAG: hypothetical protein D6736_14810 [Nitrospinota bacterium]|nr:MAG: hypothetical protein D6736_14810 [Nitrospinota bacterium]